jgi:hypothetical protein
VTPPSAPTFEWYDAWVVASILLGRGNETCDLLQLISAAVAINHAGLGLDELNSALDRLGSAGFVTVEEGRFSVSPKLLSLLDMSAIRSTGCVLVSGLVAAAIGAKRHSSSTMAPLPKKQWVSANEFASAIGLYHHKRSSRQAAKST